MRQSPPRAEPKEIHCKSRSCIWKFPECKLRALCLEALYIVPLSLEGDEGAIREGTLPTRGWELFDKDARRPPLIDASPSRLPSLRPSGLPPPDIALHVVISLRWMHLSAVLRALSCIFAFQFKCNQSKALSFPIFSTTKVCICC